MFPKITRLPEMPSTLVERVREAVLCSCGGEPGRIGLAISGGADSVFTLAALLNAGFEVSAATVDHALRTESRAEAAWAGLLCREWGADHEILTWREHGDLSNVQAEARKARYDLLSIWARDKGVSAVALGHNADDAAENLIMRGTGIRPERRVGGLLFIRPILAFDRNLVRDELRKAGVSWVDDPSNENDNYRRVRVRKMLAADENVRNAALNAARETVEETEHLVNKAEDLLARFITVRDDGLLKMNEEMRKQDVPELRHVIRAVCRAAGTPDGRIRGARLTRAAESLRNGEPFTLCGVMHIPDVGFTRDPGAVITSPVDDDGLWDKGRWEIYGAGDEPLFAHRKKNTTVPRALDGRPISCTYALSDKDVLAALRGVRDEPVDGPGLSP